MEAMKTSLPVSVTLERPVADCRVASRSLQPAAAAKIAWYYTRVISVLKKQRHDGPADRSGSEGAHQ